MSKSAFICPGQGSQSVGMGKDIASSCAASAKVYEQANEVLGFDLATLCFEGPAERLEATDIQQPAILVTSIAFWACVTDGGRLNWPFDFAAGLSLGEYTALHIAGALAFEDAVSLVHKRGRFMQEAAERNPGTMVSILGMNAEEVQSLCEQAAQGQILQPANFNCPGQIVISGEEPACQRALKLVEAGRGKALELPVAGAFHSELMRPAAERLRSELHHTPVGMPRAAVISNVDARAHEDEHAIRDALYRQVFSPVRWQESVESMIAQGAERFIELGPGRALSGMMRKIDRTVKSINISSAKSCDKFVAECSTRSSL